MVDYSDVSLCIRWVDGNHSHINPIYLTKIESNIVGKDLLKEKIKIIDGHNSLLYFWIQPVKVIDFSDTDDIDKVVELNKVEISIEEDDVDQYLRPFLYKFFDAELKANKNRVKYIWTDDEGKECVSHVEGFEWNLTHNFYTYDAISNILKDIRDTMDALSVGKENEYTSKLREKRGKATLKIAYARNMSEEQIKEYNDSRPTINDTEADVIIDFYRRFIYRMEYMIAMGKEYGYDLISIMGP